MILYSKGEILSYFITYLKFVEEFLELVRYVHPDLSKGINNFS